VSYNFSVIREIRERESIKRRDLASLLRITDHYLYLIETGKKQPGSDLLARITRITGVPLETFLNENGKFERESEEEVVADKGLRALSDLQGKLDRERHDRRSCEKRVLELEWEVEHLTALVDLHVRYEDIFAPSLTTPEKSSDVEKLARSVAHNGEFTFSEMMAVFRVKRSILKHWLDLGARAYQCRFDESRTVMADTPGEAGLRLVCFDCAEYEEGECKGYGNEKRPENLIVLLLRMEINGIFNRTEQSRVLADGFGIELTPHEISVVVYNHKIGKPVPEDAFYLDSFRKKK
jgi:transcriptional regulator with XRE-family HTH domain